MKTWNRIKKFVASNDGPTAVEYAVMLALIIVVCLVSIRTVGSKTGSSFLNTANSISAS